MNHYKNQIEICGIVFNNCRDLEWDHNDDGTLWLAFSTYISGDSGVVGEYRVVVPKIEISDTIVLKSDEGCLWKVARIDG